MGKRITSLIICIVLLIAVCIAFCSSIASAEESFDFNSAQMQELCASLTESDDIIQDSNIDEYISNVKNDLYTLTEHGSLLQTRHIPGYRYYILSTFIYL